MQLVKFKVNNNNNVKVLELTKIQCYYKVNVSCGYN